MSKGLTGPQKAMILKAYRQGGVAVDCPAVRGLALERRGYGTYRTGLRHFIINDAGRAFGRDGIQLED